jgi:hypothetical protein
MGTLPKYAVLLLGAAFACKAGAVDDADDGGGPDLPGDADETVAEALRMEIANVGPAVLMPGGAPGCLAWSATGDTDGDGIPDDVLFTFDEAGCRYDFDGGYGTVAGTKRVVDAGAPFGFDADVTGLRYIEVQSDPPMTVRRTLSGTHSLRGSALDATLSMAVSVVYERTGEETATLTEAWQARFQAPAPGIVFGMGGTLQGVTLTLQGTSSWTKTGVHYQLSLQTVTPMTWAVGCDAPWPSGGSVKATLTSGGPAGYLLYRFTGCWGDADVEFVSG